MSNLRETAYRIDRALWVRNVVGVKPAAWQEEFLRLLRWSLFGPVSRTGCAGRFCSIGSIVEVLVVSSPFHSVDLRTDPKGDDGGSVSSTPSSISATLAWNAFSTCRASVTFNEFLAGRLRRAQMAASSTEPTSLSWPRSWSRNTADNWLLRRALSESTGSFLTRAAEIFRPKSLRPSFDWPRRFGGGFSASASTGSGVLRSGASRSRHRRSGQPAHPALCAIPDDPRTWPLKVPIIAHDVGRSSDRSTAVVGGNCPFTLGARLLGIKEFRELPVGLYGSELANALATIDQTYNRDCLIVADLSNDVFVGGEWAKVGVEPLGVATALWRETHPLGKS